jgi:hypothetical protein
MKIYPSYAYFFIGSILISSFKQTIAVSLESYLFGSTTVAVAAWGCYQLYKKSKIEEQLHQMYAEHKVTSLKLQEQIADLSNETEQLQKDQEFLAEVGTYGATLEREYASELQLRTEDDIELLAHSLKDRMLHTSQQSIEQKIREAREKMAYYKHRLEAKIVHWSSKEKREFYCSKAQKLIAHLDILSVFLNTLNLTMQQYSDFIHLELLLAAHNGYYALEKSMSQDEYEHNLDKHIRSLYSDVQYQFPYLMYVERLKKDRQELQERLARAAYRKSLSSQKDIIEQAQQLDTLFKDLLEFVVTTQAYTEEKQRKPHFDYQLERQRLELKEKQDRTALELKEKQARLEEEKKMNEVKLQKELNKSQELSIQKAEIERIRKELEIKEQEISLEWARLKEGEKIKDALRKNDSLWENKWLRFRKEHEEVVDRHRSLKGQLDHLKARACESLDRLENILEQNPNRESLAEYVGKVRSVLIPLRAAIHD